MAQRMTNPMPDLAIGALAKRSGVNIETIRYYEKIGVMPKPARSSGGYRLYTSDHLKRLTFIRRGRELGFSLDELRDLLRLVDGHAYTCAEVRALTLEHVGAIRRKIADLRRLERVMSSVASQCSGRKVPDCPIIDALFQPIGNGEHHSKKRNSLIGTVAARKTSGSVLSGHASDRASRRASI